MDGVEDEALIRKYMKVLYREAIRLVSNDYDAEDVVQMCFEWALKMQNRKNITGDELIKMCRHAAERVSRYRHMKDDMFVDATMIQLDPLEVYLHKEEVERIIGCIDYLKRTYRNVLRLNISDGLRPCEISRLLGRNQYTVIKQISRGKKLLKEVLIRKGLM